MPLPASECAGKARHEHRSFALKELEAVRRNGVIDTRPGYRLAVYRCRQCRCWHVGANLLSRLGRRSA